MSVTYGRYKRGSREAEEGPPPPQAIVPELPVVEGSVCSQVVTRNLANGYAFSCGSCPIPGTLFPERPLFPLATMHFPTAFGPVPLAALSIT
jgi:hypothetical protein